VDKYPTIILAKFVLAFSMSLTFICAPAAILQGVDATADLL
jgi:hypothetical protein